MWALRLDFGPQDWEWGLNSGIWASRLEFWPQNWDLRMRDVGGEEEEVGGDNSPCVIA